MRNLCVVPMRNVFLGLLLTLSGWAQAATFDQTHEAWSALLASHVAWDAGGFASAVDYPGFKQDQAELDRYLGALSAVSRAQYASWSKPQQLAFLINSYNAFTVKLIIDNYPLQSIKDIGGLLSNPWKKQFIPLLGQTMSLDQIEHGMIREPAVFDEPRIHFAVNCASIGCPALRPEAFIAERLDVQLEDSQRRFLSDHRRNRFNPEQQRFEVSMIFDWYGDDFIKRSGSLQGYLQAHIRWLSAGAEVAPTEPEPDIEFLDYDWSLNEQL
ncbi:DUF547 domain-containing protein [Aquipseudomonas alcaligenes]|uniref:DUF547 domain-containing protein n=1 Tax=Aquipseudomonas alcaligenes TaxID=43263 RepID=UPI001F1A14B5|nr:DUF547 domain-containing protein [Pseudomonas alcaligenes]